MIILETKVKKITAVAAIAALCGIALRIVQLEFIIDSANGFFRKGYEAVGITVSVMVFVFAALSAAFAAACKLPLNKTPKMTAAFAAANFIMPAAVIYEALFTKIGTAIPSWQILAQVFFGVLCAAVFVLNGLSFFGKIKASPMLDVVFVAFWLIRVMVMFSSYVSVSTIAENVFELAALCTTLVFFLNAAKFKNGVSDGKTAVMLTGVLALVCCAVYGVPQIAVMLFGKSEMLHNSGITGFTDVATVIYISAFIHMYYFKREEPLADKPEQNEYANSVADTQNDF